MKSCVHNIIRNATNNKDIKNILITPYNSYFELSLCEFTPHNYYLLNNSVLNPHDRLFCLPNNLNDWPPFLDLDLIICNDIVSQINICTQLSTQLHIPMVIVHHQCAQSFIKKEDMYILSKNYEKAKRVVVHPLINQSWAADFTCIPYGIESNTITNKAQENKILILGNFDANSKHIIGYIKQHSSLPITIIDNNVTQTQISKYLYTHKIFLNLFNETDINPIMLQAMAEQCVVVSTNSPLNASIISNGINGYIANSIEEIVGYAHSRHPTDMGSKAQDTIRKYFNEESFKYQWNSLINTLVHTPYII
jgi:hypothetical protein